MAWSVPAYLACSKHVHCGVVRYFLDLPSTHPMPRRYVHEQTGKVILCNEAGLCHLQG